MAKYVGPGDGYSQETYYYFGEYRIGNDGGVQADIGMYCVLGWAGDLAAQIVVHIREGVGNGGGQQALSFAGKDREVDPCVKVSYDVDDQRVVDILWAVYGESKCGGKGPCE